MWNNNPNRLRSILILFWLMSLGGCRERQSVIPTSQMDVEQRFWVRVLLLENETSCKIKIPSKFDVLAPQTPTEFTARYKHKQPEQTTLVIKVQAGKIRVDNKPLTDHQAIISPDTPHIFNLNGDSYRGKLKLVLNADRKTFNAITLVPLEPYLAGVVGAEMHSYWEPQALKAQAIAARTYCMYIKKRFGRSRSWDVRKTQASQAYHGFDAESKSVWEAVNKTWGQVLVCDNVAGVKEIFCSYYSSACGGHTENSKHVFGGQEFAPLSGVNCPYCRYAAKPNNFFWPMVQFDKDVVEKQLFGRYPTLVKLGKLTKIEVAAESKYETLRRLTLLKLVGSTGKSDNIRAEDLRLTIDPTGRKIKSTSCEIFDMGDKWAFLSGRGFGHGVGMCQCGAQAMARKGADAERILYHYYPGSAIEKLY